MRPMRARWGGGIQVPTELAPTQLTEHHVICKSDQATDHSVCGQPEALAGSRDSSVLWCRRQDPAYEVWTNLHRIPLLANTFAGCSIACATMQDRINGPGAHPEPESFKSVRDKEWGLIQETFQFDCSKGSDALLLLLLLSTEDQYSIVILLELAPQELLE